MAKQTDGGIIKQILESLQRLKSEKKAELDGECDKSLAFLKEQFTQKGSRLLATGGKNFKALLEQDEKAKIKYMTVDEETFRSAKEQDKENAGPGNMSKIRTPLKAKGEKKRRSDEGQIQDSSSKKPEKKPRLPEKVKTKEDYIEECSGMTVIQLRQKLKDLGVNLKGMKLKKEFVDCLASVLAEDECGDENGEPSSVRKLVPQEPAQTVEADVAKAEELQDAKDGKDAADDSEDELLNRMEMPNKEPTPSLSANSTFATDSPHVQKTPSIDASIAVSQETVKSEERQISVDVLLDEDVQQSEDVTEELANLPSSGQADMDIVTQSPRKRDTQPSQEHLTEASENIDTSADHEPQSDHNTAEQDSLDDSKKRRQPEIQNTPDKQPLRKKDSTGIAQSPMVPPVFPKLSEKETSNTVPAARLSAATIQLPETVEEQEEPAKQPASDPEGASTLKDPEAERRQRLLEEKEERENRERALIEEKLGMQSNSTNFAEGLHGRTLPPSFKLPRASDASKRLSSPARVNHTSTKNEFEGGLANLAASQGDDRQKALRDEMEDRIRRMSSQSVQQDMILQAEEFRNMVRKQVELKMKNTAQDASASVSQSIASSPARLSEPTKIASTSTSIPRALPVSGHAKTAPSPNAQKILSKTSAIPIPSKQNKPVGTPTQTSAPITKSVELNAKKTPSTQPSTSLVPPGSIANSSKGKASTTASERPTTSVAQKTGSKGSFFPSFKTFTKERNGDSSPVKSALAKTKQLIPRFISSDKQSKTENTSSDTSFSASDKVSESEKRSSVASIISVGSVASLSSTGSGFPVPPPAPSSSLSTSVPYEPSKLSKAQNMNTPHRILLEKQRQQLKEEQALEQQIRDQQEKEQLDLEKKKASTIAAQERTVVSGTPLEPVKKEEDEWKAENNYEISDREDSESDEDDSEDESNKKPVPSWAQKQNIMLALREQYYGATKPDPDEIFGEIPVCDLETIFKTSKKRYKERGSSGAWHLDGLTVKEKRQYRRDLGLEK